MSIQMFIKDQYQHKRKKRVTYFQQAALFSCTPGMRIQAGIKFVCFSPFVLSVSRSLLCPLSVHTHMTHVYLPRFRAAELQCWTTKPKCSCTDVASEHTQKQRAGLIELGNSPLFTTEMTFPTAGSDTSVELISVRNSLKRGRKTWQAALFQLLFNCSVLSCS